MTTPDTITVTVDLEPDAVEYLRRLKDAGLRSFPGTAAEIIYLVADALPEPERPLEPGDKVKAGSYRRHLTVVGAHPTDEGWTVVVDDEDDLHQFRTRELVRR